MSNDCTSISNPLEPQELEQAITELVSGNRVKLWAYPDVAVRLGQVLKREDVGLAEVARLVSADPALAGVVMRLANAVTYQRSGAEIQRVPDAVARIGIKGVHRLAVAVGLGSQVCKEGPLQVLRFRAWRWSVSSALVCQELAPRRLLDPGVAFLGGLLYGFGRAAALAALEQALDVRRNTAPLPVALWHSIVESRRRQFGALVAREWSLPPLVNAVLLDDGDDNDNDESERSRLVELCRLADRIVTTVESGPGVSPGQLGSLTGFAGPDEIMFATGVVERLPWAIEALLEVPAPPGRALANAIEFPATSLQGALRPADFPVTNVKSHESAEYRATHVASDGLVIVGALPMQVNNIARLELCRGDAPFRVWVRVAQCEPRDDGYRIEVQPFALGTEDRANWADAVEG